MTALELRFGDEHRKLENLATETSVDAIRDVEVKKVLQLSRYQTLKSNNPISNKYELGS